MKKLIVITSLFLLTFIVSIQGVFAFELEEDDSYYYSYLPNYLSDNTSAWTIRNPSSGVYVVTNIFSQWTKNNYYVHNSNFKRITYLGVAPVFPLPFSSSMVGYSLNVLRNSKVLYNFTEDSSTLPYYNTTQFIGDSFLGSSSLSASNITYSVTLFTSNNNLDNQDIIDNVYHIFWKYKIKFGGIDDNDYTLNFGNVDDYYDNGYKQGMNDYAYNNDGILVNGYSAFELGYTKGINENVETMGFAGLLSSMFTALGVFLSIELLPNITFGTFVLVPLVFGVILFIMGRKK